MRIPQNSFLGYVKVRKVSEKQILSELQELDPKRWFEVLDFIGYLKRHTSLKRKAERARELTARELLQSELVGIWADRDDIDGSLTFARQLRWQAEHRWETGDDLA
jgi:hypothetical protein